MWLCGPAFAESLPNPIHPASSQNVGFSPLERASVQSVYPSQFEQYGQIFLRSRHYRNRFINLK
jgi:hypothetical protein